MASEESSASPTGERDLFQRLLGHLGRGGKWQYLWRLADRRSAWFAAGGRLPAFRTDRDLYFGVHPTRAAGQATERSVKDAGDLATAPRAVCAVNALFAEFDAKDFGGDLASVLWYAKHLRIPPSVCICSGGGYHGYWLLSEPALITDGNRGQLQRLQARWVDLVGGDPGSKDLARVLRVPGTLNTKYDPPRPVTIVWYDNDLFPIECLQTHVDTFGAPDQPPAPPDMAVNILREQARSRTPQGYRARAYGLAAMQRELNALAHTGKGNRNRHLNNAALKLGSLVGGGLLEQDEALRALANTALSMGIDSSFAPAGIRATIKSGFEAGLKRPRGVPDGAR